MCEEIFAPVVSVVPFGALDDAITQVNSTPFGLAAGLFTRDVMRAMDAARRLHVGVVHINEPSSSRVDLMPFAGVKDSGVGTRGSEVRDARNDRRTPCHDQPVLGVTMTTMNDRSDVHRRMPAAGRRHQGVRPMRAHELRVDRCVPQDRNRVRVVSPRAAGGACRRRVLPRFAQARGHQRPSFAGPHQRVDGSRDRGSRRHADGRDRGQYAVLSSRARAAPGRSAARGCVAGRHLRPDLQARVARRRRQVSARRHAARAQSGADRTVGRGADRRTDGRVLPARWTPRPARVARRPASLAHDRAGRRHRRCGAAAHHGGAARHLRRQWRRVERSRRASSRSSPSCWRRRSRRR